MLAAQARERGRRRPKNAARVIAVRLVQNIPKFLRRAERSGRVLVTHQQQCERDEWRITVISSMPNLFFVKTTIVLRRRVTKRVMGWMVSLNQHSAWQIAASGASGDLGNQLKGSFSGAKVRQCESGI